MQKKLGILLISVILAICCLTGCAEKEGTLQNFKIFKYEDWVSEDVMDFFNEKAQVYQDTGLGKSDKDQSGRIYLVCQEEFAQNVGFTLNGMGENAFRIECRNDSLYLFAPNEEGMKRAITHLLKYLVDTNGEILLENGAQYVDDGANVKTDIFIGDAPIEEYVIAYGSEEVKVLGEKLQCYIGQTSMCYPQIVEQKSATGKAILLTLDETLEEGRPAIMITDGQVKIVAKDAKGLQESMYLFVNTYLGWIKAGSQEECLTDNTSVLRIPAEVSGQTPWIEEREATIVLWNINYNRGFHLNANTSLKNNIIDFSEEQLYEYVKMLKYCGYTGVQVTEMCSAWAGTGSYEAVHEKIRTLADAAHSLDMKFTLWVWGAEFNGYGWVDETVSYTPTDGFVHKNPESVATFEKYYSIYAELADCCDRVIAHYYDPGNLYLAEDIAYFAKMLKDKFHAVNPDIDFGVSCWVDIYDKKIFVDALGNDITLYECGHHDNEGDYNSFRNEVKGLGCRIGTWAWNTCEMEIDQLAQMNFNMDIIRSVYQTARKYDGIEKTTYWSEMDSYHVLNVFSLYCAGQMLINPDIPSEVLFENISTAAVGPEYAEAFAEILDIIQDARSGSSWDTYFWSNANYIVKSDSYPAEQLLKRCNDVMPILQEMIDKNVESYSLPLPIELQEVLKMIQPHLEQIRTYAEFRMALAALEADSAKGMTVEELTARVEAISVPIKDYNCIIGTWGQIEARAQQELLAEFCGRAGIEKPVNEGFDAKRKQYILSQLISFQLGKQEPYMLASPYYQWGRAYGLEETTRLVNELVEEGFLVKAENGAVYLADWENYIYHFN